MKKKKILETEGYQTIIKLSGILLKNLARLKEGLGGKYSIEHK